MPYLDEETYRRQILTQLNRGEDRHSLSHLSDYCDWDSSLNHATGHFSSALLMNF
jgi:Tn3 transposase DDE domain